MVDEDLVQELEFLGFTPNGAKVYLALLRLGKAAAGRLAKECNLERTSTYNALKKLEEDGVVSVVNEANKKVFSVCGPNKVKDIFKEKERRAARIVPQLEELKKTGEEKESILKFKGPEGIKTVFEDILNTCSKGEEYLIFGSAGQLSERMPVYSEIFVAKKDQKELRARILMNEKFRMTGRKKSKYTKVRYVPNNVISLSNMDVYGDKVAILTWGETPEAIIIDDKATADSFRSYFEFMWKSAEK